MKKVSISFSALSDVNFRKKAELILRSLQDNTAYTGLTPSLEVVEAALLAYSVALLAALNKDRLAVAEKNKCRKDLEVLLRQLGLCVMMQANGDIPTLVSSGFTLNKTPEVNYITNPGNVTLSNGITSGAMVSMVKAVSGSRCYVHEISPDQPAEGTVWAANTSSTSSFTFTNLLPGKQYWIRVAVIGARGQKAYSNVASRFAQ